MEHILVMNAGSSSLKARLFEVPSLRAIISFSKSNLNTSTGHERALEEIAQEIVSYRDSIKYIAHRIVMGGEGAKNGEPADEDVIKRLKKVSDLAPLHNPKALLVLKACIKKFPLAINAVAYDTAFFANLPEEEFTYPIDKNIASRLGIRRYGFHGLSHQYAYNHANKYSKMVSIHLGAGCSITALSNGRPIATSMGMTPQGGLVMQSRAGDIDPGTLFYIAEQIGLKKAKDMFESGSGLKGITGTSGEMLDILALTSSPIEGEYEYKGPNNQYLRHQAQIALDIYTQRVRDFIGSYATRLAGLESIVFTGQIGFRSKYLRDKITYGLDYLNLREVAAIEANEELAIAEIMYNKYY